MKSLIAVGLIALSTSCFAESKADCEQHASNFGTKVLSVRLGVDPTRVDEHIGGPVDYALGYSWMVNKYKINLKDLSIIQIENEFYKLCVKEYVK